MTEKSKTCWICGGDATTGEHRSKRSDMKAVFGPVSQAVPIFYHDAKSKNRRIGSLDSKALKSSSRLCPYCNNTRTQPHDRAWEALSHALRSRSPAIMPGGIVRANRIFPYDTARRMRDVQLYFIKVFGCHALEHDVSIDVASFASAIMRSRAHPLVYLRFGCAPSFGGHDFVGASDMHSALHATTGRCAFATWFYNVSNLSVNVMFAEAGERREGMVGAWNPQRGTNKLRIFDFQE